MATNGQTQTTTTVKADGISPAEYDQVSHITRTVTEHHNGHQVDFQVDQTGDVELSGTFDDRVKSIVNGAIKEREDRENLRANKRNLNRMLTLFCALIIGLVVTFFLTTPGMVPASWKFLEPYNFVITLVLDSGLALYGFIRKY